jgi:hypothetical protein
LAPYRGKNYGIRLRPVGFYQFPPVPGRSWERWLNVDMTALSGGGTAVIAQAGDGWVRPPRRELLHRGVRRIDIVSRIGNRAPNVLVHVHRPYEVGSIVALVNGLGIANAEHIFCAAVLYGGPRVSLRFRAASGKVLASATVSNTLGRGYSGPCNPLQLTVGGRVTPLIGADLLRRLELLLRINLAPPLPRDVSDCLQRHRWKVQSVSHKEMIEREQTFPPELTVAKDRRHWTITFPDTGKVTLDRAGPRVLEHCIRKRRG